MPKEHEGRFLRDAAGEGKVDVGGWLSKHLEGLRQNPEDVNLRKQLRATCDSILEASKAFESDKAAQRGHDISSTSWARGEVHRLPDRAIGCIAEAALQMDDAALFKAAVSQVQVALPLKVFYGLGMKIAWEGLESLLKGIKHSKQLHHRYAAFENALGGYQTINEPTDAVMSELTNIEREAMTTALACDMPVVKEDGQILARLVLRHGEPFSSQLKQLSNSTFAVSFLIYLYDLSECTHPESVPKDLVRKMCHDLVQDVICAFALEFNKPPKAPKVPLPWSHLLRRSSPSPEPSKPNFMTSTELAKLAFIISDMGLSDEVKSLVQKITTSCESVAMTAFETLLLPFLKILRDLCRDGDRISIDDASENDMTSKFSPLYQGVLASYLTRFVGAEPVHPSDWRRPSKGCGSHTCADCKQLDRFLTSPTQQRGRFPIYNNRRAHLHGLVDGDLGLTHDTERTGSPQTLVITKTDKGWQNEHRLWKCGCLTAKSQMEALEPELRRLLGDRYNEITGLDAVKTAEYNTGIKDSGNRERKLLASVQQVPNGLKRKAGDDGEGAKEAKRSKGAENRGGPEIVDLT
ncbi:MAG: hypothetical protein Q9218_003836 [Villophora microphyllina]